MATSSSSSVEVFNKGLNTQDDKLTEQNYLNKANEYSQSKQYEDAIAAYDKALEVNPKNGATYKGKGEALFNLKKYEDAVTCFQKAIEIDPKDAWSHRQLGYNLSELKQYEAAVASYQKAIEIDPKNAWSHRLLGWNLSQLKQYEAAIASCQKAIEIDPKDEEAQFRIAFSFYHLGQSEAAIAGYKKVVEINPNHDAAWNNLGEELTVVGNFREAIEAYDQVLKINPEYSGPIYSNKGFVLYLLGEIEEAIKLYDKQLELTPGLLQVIVKKGKALQDLNKTAEAMEYFQKGMKIINQGKLDDSSITHPNGEREFLNKLEVQLIASIKELLAIPTLQVTSAEPEKVKTQVQELNQKRDDLKLKFINAALSKKKERAKQEEFDQLKKEMEELKNMYKQVAIELAEVKADIQDSGMKELAEVKRGFKALEEEDPELLAYCKTFYWTSMNLFGAYRAMSTGLMQANFEAEADQNEDMLVNGAMKATSLLADVASGVPLVGGIMSQLNTIIDSIYGAIKENRFNNKVAAINKVIQAKLGTEDEISLNVSKAALAITLAKKNAILYPEIASSTPATTSQKIQAGLEWLTTQIDQVKGKVLPSVDLQDKDSKGATMALQDVTLFIAYIGKNYESIINRKQGLDKQIITIIELNGLEKLLEGRDNTGTTELTQEVTNPQGCSNCAMF